MPGFLRDIATSADVRLAYDYADDVSTETGGEIIDTIGFNSVAFVGKLVDTGSSASISVKQSDASNMANPESLGGGATTDSATFVLDVSLVSKRYLQLFVTGTGGNAAVHAMAVLYNPDSEPVDQSAGISQVLT